MADVEYGIDVNNKFAFLEDDEHDPDQTVEAKSKQVITEARQKKREQRIAEKAAAIKEESKKDSTPKPDGKENHRIDDVENRRGGVRRGGRGGSRGVRGRGGDRPRSERPPRQFDGEHQPVHGENGERGGRGGGYRGRGRGRGGYRPDGDREYQEGGESRGGGYRGVRGRGFHRGFRGGNNHYRDENQQHGENDVSHWAPTNEVQDGLIDAVDNRPTQDNIAPRMDGEFRGRGRSGRSGFRRSTGRGGGYDRHSGSDRTGVKPVEKRGGAGKGNWGTAHDELIGETETLNVTENKENEAAPPTEGENGVVATPVVEDGKVEEAAPEERGLTLAEYKAQQQKDDNKFNVRRVHAPKEMKVIPNKLDESYEHEEIIVHTRPSKKTFVDLPLQMQNEGTGGAPRRGGGGAGGDRGDHPRAERSDFPRERGAFRADRGGGRGGSGARGGAGGRGGPRGGGGASGGFYGRGDHRGGHGGRGYGRGDAFNVENESEFPAL